MLKRALEISKAEWGADDVDVARTLGEMGQCVQQQAGRLGKAEALYRRALEIREVKFGADDPKICGDIGRDGSVCAAGGTARADGRVV